MKVDLVVPYLILVFLCETEMEEIINMDWEEK